MHTKKMWQKSNFWDVQNLQYPENAAFYMKNIKRPFSVRLGELNFSSTTGGRHPVYIKRYCNYTFIHFIPFLNTLFIHISEYHLNV